MVILGQNDCIGAKGFYSGKSGCIRIKKVVLGKMAVFGLKWF